MNRAWHIRATCARKAFADFKDRPTPHRIGDKEGMMTDRPVAGVIIPEGYDDAAEFAEDNTAEALRKRVGELEVERDRMKEALELARSQVDGNTYGRTKTLAVIDAALVPSYLGWSNTRAEQAEAQLAQVTKQNDVLREALDQFKSSLDTRLNDVLCGMKEGYDDSIVDFNEAWDVMRKAFADFKARAAFQQTAPATVESTSPDSA